MHLEAVRMLLATEVIAYGHRDHNALLISWAGDTNMIGVANQVITQVKISL